MAEPFGPRVLRAADSLSCRRGQVPLICLLFVCANHLLVRARAVRFANNSPAFEVRLRIDEIVSLQPGGACDGISQAVAIGSHGQLAGPLRQRFTVACQFVVSLRQLFAHCSQSSSVGKKFTSL
jgi:hypothetical protein